MQLDTKPLIDAINRLIAKADDDLKDSLEAEGYVAASELVKNINKLEDAIDDALDADSLEFLEKIEAATGVTDFITDIWPGIKDADDLEKALREIFRGFLPKTQCLQQRWRKSQSLQKHSFRDGQENLPGL